MPPRGPDTVTLPPPAEVASAEAAPPADAQPADPALVRVIDRGLELALVGLAAWTLAYHLCVLARWGSTAAIVIAVVLLAAGAWAVLAWPAGAPSPLPPARVRRPRLLGGATAAAAVAAAIAFAVAGTPWGVTWVLWLLAAGGGLALALGGRERPAARLRLPTWDALIALGWAAGLALLSLIILNPDDDDAYYVHLAAWIGAHGTFPIRDVQFSDQVLPMLYYPPIPSWEALTGVAARLIAHPAATVVYIVVPPIVSALSALALWRLLRGWRVRIPALALSVAVVFLLFYAKGLRVPGAFFITRIWQGKVVLACLAVPLLIALALEHLERPGRRSVLLLAAGGIAAVGLSTTAMFLVPVIAVGTLAGGALRVPRRAAVAFAALAAYPLASGVVTLALGGRQPEHYTAQDVIASRLPHFVLGTGPKAAIALGAVLLAPFVLRRTAALVVAGTALVVGLLYTPGLPLAIFRVTDLGRVQWRYMWALPTAALVGALAVGATRRGWPRAATLVPAAAIVVAMVALGVPAWSGRVGAVITRPHYKRPLKQMRDARPILRHIRPGDVVLAPSKVSVTLDVSSGNLTTVEGRWFYVHVIEDGTRGPRHLLQHFADGKLVATPGQPLAAKHRRVAPDLRLVRVTLACVHHHGVGAQRLLAAAGWHRAFPTPKLWCYRR